MTYTYLSRVPQKENINIFVPISKLSSLWFLSHLGNPCTAQIPWLSPLCSPRSFMAFDFILNPIIHGEFIILPPCRVWTEGYPACVVPRPRGRWTCCFKSRSLSSSEVIVFGEFDSHFLCSNFSLPFGESLLCFHLRSGDGSSSNALSGEPDSGTWRSQRQVSGQKRVISDTSILLGLEGAISFLTQHSSMRRHLFFPLLIALPHASTPAGFSCTPPRATTRQVTLLSLPLPRSHLGLCVHICSLWEERLLRRHSWNKQIQTNASSGIS